MRFIWGFLCLIVAFLIYKMNKKTYSGGYIEIGHKIQGYGLILILVVIALLLFIGVIR